VGGGKAVQGKNLLPKRWPIASFANDENLADRIGHRLLIGWVIALIGGIAGLFLSYWWDLPSGAAIVCTFGALLVLVSTYTLIRGPWARMAEE
jgi:ABC-type Mn2+/Zn2+ transport system permease subunit